LDRSGGLNKVDSIAAILTGRKFFVWQLLRRNPKKELKTGFYYIALKANVPIIPVAFDFVRKKLILNSSFTFWNYRK
jgi:1-acyl-sn-glycerol-3-phosphate acyltransferase